MTMTSAWFSERPESLTIVNLSVSVPPLVRLSSVTSARTPLNGPSDVPMGAGAAARAAGGAGAVAGAGAGAGAAAAAVVPAEAVDSCFEQPKAAVSTIAPETSTIAFM
jgi:hypothetical protein